MHEIEENLDQASALFVVSHSFGFFLIQIFIDFHKHQLKLAIKYLKMRKDYGFGMKTFWRSRMASLKWIWFNKIYRRGVKNIFYFIYSPSPSLSSLARLIFCIEQNILFHFHLLLASSLFVFFPSRCWEIADCCRKKENKEQKLHSYALSPSCEVVSVY